MSINNNDNRSIKGWESWLAAANRLISDIEEFAKEEYSKQEYVKAFNALFMPQMNKFILGIDPGSSKREEEEEDKKEE